MSLTVLAAQAVATVDIFSSNLGPAAGLYAHAHAPPLQAPHLPHTILPLPTHVSATFLPDSSALTCSLLGLPTPFLTLNRVPFHFLDPCAHSLPGLQTGGGGGSSPRAWPELPSCGGTENSPAQGM